MLAIYSPHLEVCSEPAFEETVEDHIPGASVQTLGCVLGEGQAAEILSSLKHQLARLCCRRFAFLSEEKLVIFHLVSQDIQNSAGKRLMTTDDRPTACQKSVLLRSFSYSRSLKIPLHKGFD